MTFEQPIVAGSTQRSRRWIQLVFVIAIGALLYRWCMFAAAGWNALHFPWELDYGEGIVWEQMRLMVNGRGYGPIDGIPAIVFHYPPLYHLVTAGVAALGIDPLYAGRAVSLASTFVVSLVASAICYKIVRPDTERGAALLCALVAGIGLYCFAPVVQWAILMRVDMLSLALSLGGVLAAMAAWRRPWWIVISGLAFVAAIYTKQTSLAAPAAVFLTYLLVRPRLAWSLLGVCLAGGLIVLFVMQLLTDGGFFRHVFLYNVNRFQWGRLGAIAVQAVGHLMFALAIAMGVFTRLRQRLPGYRGRSFAGIRQRLGESAPDAQFLMILLYAVLAGLMSFSIAKSGSNVNYFLEAMAVLSILLGIATRDAATLAFANGERRPGVFFSPDFIPLLLCGQAFMAVSPTHYMSETAYLNPQRQTLTRLVAAADKPVSSDDMVVLLRAGKNVSWEPAIFAELATTGAWDERPLVQRIRRGEFAFFITEGERGDYEFDSRYNRAVADAMYAAYPVKREFGGLILHLPKTMDLVPSESDQEQPLPAK